MRKINSQKGFTLVEMLVVVAIIAILSSVFLVGLRGFRGSAYDSRRLSDLQKVQSYLELYYNQNREYPNASTWADLNAVIKAASIGVSGLPEDPTAKDDANLGYQYAVSTSLQSYVLGARLSDVKSSALNEPNEIDQVGDVSLPGGDSFSNFPACDDASGWYCVQF